MFWKEDATSHLFLFTSRIRSLLFVFTRNDASSTCPSCWKEKSSLLCITDSQPRTNLGQNYTAKFRFYLCYRGNVPLGSTWSQSHGKYRFDLSFLQVTGIRGLKAISTPLRPCTWRNGDQWAHGHRPRQDYAVRCVDQVGYSSRRWYQEQ